MDIDYKNTPFYKWIRTCFWVLMFIYLPTYFITRYWNEDKSMGDGWRLFNTMWFLPTQQTYWESYLLTSSQLDDYLVHSTLPQKDFSCFLTDPNGNYFILFRFKIDRFYSRTYAARIKCYIEGVDFPLDFVVHPGYLDLKDEFKDHIVPVHINPNKVKSKPHHHIQWVHMDRR